MASIQPLVSRGIAPQIAIEEYQPVFGDRVQPQDLVNGLVELQVASGAGPEVLGGDIPCSDHLLHQDRVPGQLVDERAT